MKIVTLSDTHCQLGDFSIPEGDLLLHAGDLTYRGTFEEMSKELKKLGGIAQKFKYGCAFVAGNHDWLGEKNPDLLRMLAKENNLIYLQDEGTVINGFNIWGSPWQPAFGGWAFNLKRGDPLKTKWDLIPKDTHLLITHGPPKGYGDIVMEGDGEGWPYADFKYKAINVGCWDLLHGIQQLPELKLHVFGHIHGGHGIYKHNNVTLVNASVCTEEYKPSQEPIIIDI